jgi:hypothetical protein
VKPQSRRSTRAGLPAPSFEGRFPFGLVAALTDEWQNQFRRECAQRFTNENTNCVGATLATDHVVANCATGSWHNLGEAPGQLRLPFTAACTLVDHLHDQLHVTSPGLAARAAIEATREILQRNRPDITPGGPFRSLTTYGTYATVFRRSDRPLGGPNSHFLGICWLLSMSVGTVRCTAD